MVLKNLMRGAYDRQINGLPAPATTPPPPAPKPVVETKPPVKVVREENGETALRPTVRLKEAKPATRSKPKESADYIKLVTLRDQGILTDQEFQAALGRLVSAGKK
jgi:hypothetical protein